MFILDFLHFLKLNLENPILYGLDNALFFPPFILVLNRHGSFLTSLLLLFHPAFDNRHSTFLNILDVMIPLLTVNRPVSYDSGRGKNIFSRGLLYSLDVLLCVKFLFWLLNLWFDAQKTILLGVDWFTRFWRRECFLWGLQLFHVFQLYFMDLV